MKSLERGFTCSDVLECVDFLRSRAYGKPLACMIGLVGTYVVEAELGRMLHYLVRRGRLRRRGKGKTTRYALQTAVDDDEVVRMKGRKSRAAWNGRWHVLTYDMPTTHNAMRRRLTQRLHEMGFAALCASSWVSPYDWRDLLDEMLSDPLCGGRFYYAQSASVSRLAARNEGDLATLWDVGEVARRYRKLAGRCAKTPLGGTTPEQKRRATTLFAARKELRLIEKLDPMLPGRLLPHPWPRRDALKNIEHLSAATRRDIDRAAQ